LTLVDVGRSLVFSGEDSRSSCWVGVAIDDVLQDVAIDTFELPRAASDDRRSLRIGVAVYT
jgi:hypothetical protein